MEGEIEMHQPEIPPVSSDWRRRPFVVLIVIAVVLVGVIIWIGNWALNKETVPLSAPGLTEAQKAEILKSLQLPPGAKPLTDAQKAEIQKSLELPPGAPPLTEAQRAEILRSLK